MSLDLFTSYPEVRAVLGVSDEELEDITLALPMYSLKLQMELEEVYVGLYDLYITTRDLPVVSPAEQKLLNVVQVFSAYAVSKSLLASSTLFAPQKITDGRAGMERFDATENLRDEIEQTLVALKARILAVLGVLGLVVPVTSPRVYFGAAGLSINPITNLR